MRTILTLSLMFATSVACAQGIWHTLDFAVAVRGLATEVRIREPIVPVALPMPEYPSDLARAGIAGDASVRFFVKADGTVGEVEILSATQREFRDAARAAVARWRFQAFATDGKRQIEKAAWMKCRILFRREEE